MKTNQSIIKSIGRIATTGGAVLLIVGILLSMISQTALANGPVPGGPGPVIIHATQPPAPQQPVQSQPRSLSPDKKIVPLQPIVPIAQPNPSSGIVVPMHGPEIVFNGGCQGDCTIVWARICYITDMVPFTTTVNWTLYLSNGGIPQNGTVVDSGTIPGFNPGDCTNISHVPTATGTYTFYVTTTSSEIPPVLSSSCVINSLTCSITSTPTATATSTATETVTPTATATSTTTATPTHTVTATITSTVTNTPTSTTTATVTSTATPTETATVTVTHTATVTVTGTPVTPTHTFTPTVTEITSTPTRTPSLPPPPGEKPSVTPQGPTDPTPTAGPTQPIIPRTGEDLPLPFPLTDFLIYAGLVLLGLGFITTGLSKRLFKQK